MNNPKDFCEFCGFCSKTLIHTKNGKVYCSDKCLKEHMVILVRNLIEANDVAVGRAMVAIHNLQTKDEQNSRATKESNGVGFNSFDARNGSYYAAWVKSGKVLTGRFLARARRMAKKYQGQLVAIAVADQRYGYVQDREPAIHGIPVIGIG